MVTAGHVLAELQTAKSLGATFKYELEDRYAQSSLYRIPFDLDACNPWHLYDAGEGIDYAVVHLSRYYAELLQKNGILPLDETYWRIDSSEQFDRFFLFGIPEEKSRLTTTGNRDHVALVLMEVFPMEIPPDTLNKSVPRFYGKLVDDPQAPQSIEGMSGGPLLGFKRITPDNYQIKVVGIQSGWDRKKRVIAANFLLPLTLALTNILYQIRHKPEKSVPLVPD